MYSEITSKQQIDNQAISQSNRLKGSMALKTPNIKMESKHYRILRKDQAWLEGYVRTKRSKYTKIHVNADLQRFYDFIIENYPAVKSILEVNPLQFRAYFEHIDQRPVRKNVKNKWRTNLKAFIFWIISPELAQGNLPKINYEMIFSNKYYSFRESSGPREEDPLTREDVLECLHFYQGRNFRDFVLFSLLAYTGMRIGGLISLQILL
jgi:integrase